MMTTFNFRSTSRPILCAILGLLAVLFSEAQAAGTQCKTQECFAEHINGCEAATFNTQIVAGGRARYTVYGPPGEDDCVIGFEFLKNPNLALVGPTLSFVVDTKQDTEPQLKEAVADCLQGRKSKYFCSGPLWELAGGSDKVEIRMAAEPPCGVPVEDEGPPLYPWPHDGRWGYVTRDGEWVIEPQWIQAEPFSEGRAAVDGGVEHGGLWGLIDREGNYVLEPFLKSDRCSSEGLRLCDSPLKPFSEGCTSAQHFDEYSRYLFVARDGSLWHYNTLPQGVTERSFGGFGDFSEGKVWFYGLDSGPGKNKYGWIDASGEVVIPRQYSGAGNFVNGLAPAAQGGDFWALMDETGQPRVPARWKYLNMRDFSEGLVAVRIDVFRWMYFSRDGIAIEKISFKTPDQTGPGPAGEAGIIGEAGSFHDGLAPVKPKWSSHDEFLFIRPDGSEVFSPARDLNLKVCIETTLPEYRHGLVRLLVANEGYRCEDVNHVVGNPAHYDRAHYVYLDTSGKIVLEQRWREGDTDAKP